MKYTPQRVSKMLPKCLANLERAVVVSVGVAGEVAEAVGAVVAKKRNAKKDCLVQFFLS